MQQVLRFPSDNLWLSGVIWLVALIALLYVARRPAHTLIRTAGTQLARALRRAHRGLHRSHRIVTARYRRLLLAYARERTELQVGRELLRLERTIARDLSGIPHLDRSLREQLHRLDEDYRRTVEVPPSPPEWVRAVETVAAMERPDDPSVVRVLEDMHTTLERACHHTLQSYREASHRRHRTLRRAVPMWRHIHSLLDHIQRGVARVDHRAVSVQRQIVRFRALAESHRDRARRTAGLVFARWCTAIVTLAVIAAAAVTLYGLIERPLAEVGAGLGSSPDGSDYTQWLAMSLIGLLAVCGLLISEALGMTRLVPGLALGRPALRTAAAGVAGVLLLLLASAAAALAWTRDYLLSLDASTEALFTASGGGFPEPVFLWIPTLSQSVIAFGLALVVSLIALPFENVLRQGALAATATAGAALAVAGALARTLAAVVVTITGVVLAVYDVLVCLPLFVERIIRRHRVANIATQPPTVEDAG
ncbi:hypothetical protein [Arhodomonas sp. AD133]|uniref:hypothetical protein n=1 Tax=Arhodomonas sp. AD133 TaxID=3415009 RepID=UPI003EC131DB